MNKKINKSNSGARKAGEILRNNFKNGEVYNNEALDILSWWRESHQDSLNIALAILQKESIKIDSKPILAKRLKRAPSIIEKLNRLSNDSETSKLDRMQDIGGCRVVVTSPKKAKKIANILKNDYKYKLKNDYIEKPKDNGYKSIHLVGKIENFEGKSKQIEFQIRSKIQHYWATTLEIFDIYNKTSIKTGEIDFYWSRFWKNISDVFEIFESNIHVHTSTSEQIYSSFLNEIRGSNSLLQKKLHTIYILDKKLQIRKKLNLYRKSLKETVNYINENIPTDADVYALITITETQNNEYNMNVLFYSKDNYNTANKDYLAEEKRYFSNKNFITALVSTNSMNNIKEAYPNYFADSSKFETYLDMIISAYEKENGIVFILFNRIRYFEYRDYVPKFIFYFMDRFKNRMQFGK